MILLTTSLPKAQNCASALQEATNEAVEVCATLHEAVMQLEDREFSAVVIDQLLLDSEPEEAETFFKHLGTAVPVYVNFAVSGIERVIRELRSALHRRSKEVLVARREAQQAMSHELRETVTALLLSCEIALEVPGLPTIAEGKLRNLRGLAEVLREKLGE